MRFWCLGDSGTNRAGTANPGKARRARDGFRRYNKQPWRTLDTPQMQWLEEDLATTSQDWSIVVSHIPAFCNGRYNAVIQNGSSR